MIKIVPYNSDWPQQFETAKSELLKIFEGLTLSIDHIGSTSVPGLSAKDCIDIQISLPNFDDALIQSINEKLARSNYPIIEKRNDHRPPNDVSDDCHWEKFYLNGAPFSFKANIHVRVKGRHNQAYPLIFRDYLRANPTVAAAYAETKIRLAAHLKDDIDTYCDLKDPVCDIILEQAKLSNPKSI